MVSKTCVNTQAEKTEDALIYLWYNLYQINKMSEDKSTTCFSADMDLAKSVAALVNDVINAALLKAELKQMKTTNGHGISQFTSIVVHDYDNNNYPVESRNAFVGISKSDNREKILPYKQPDEQRGNISFSLDTVDPKVAKPKRKKKLSFSSIFHFSKPKSKGQKVEEDTEDYDTFSHTLLDFQSSPLSKSRQFSSAVELRSKTIPAKNEKSSSLFKKLASVRDESTSFLRRSFSFRDVRKKEKGNSREVVAERKTQEWRQSLQSLVENDFSVSYNDLSFINYDALNEFTYNEPVRLKPGRTENNFVGRTQSLREKGSVISKKPVLYCRHTSVTPDFGSITDFKDHPTLSLPVLNNDSRRVADPYSCLSSDQSAPAIFANRRHRDYSLTSEGSCVENESFRSNSSGESASGGYVKLRHHNASRQKIRPSSTSVSSNPDKDHQEVRSRSLNHLDTLEMHQSEVSSADTALKDSKSEPDCTRPVLLSASSAVAPSVDSDTPSTTVDKHHTVSASRKHMLSRSQKSSSECFSVNFEVGDESTWDNELFFPALRGLTLYDSLAKLCELRNIDLSLCDARLQDKENNLESFVSFTQDTASLVGRHVRITGKDVCNKKPHGPFHSNHSRKQSGSYKPRTSNFFSSSTEDQAVVGSSTLSLHESDQSKKQIKQRLTAFFGNSKDMKYEALIEQLDRYSKHGPPHNFDYHQGQCEAIDALFKLEDDWKDIINDYSDLSERQQQQQTALWELIKTEVAYIKTLKVVTDLFLSCLRDLQSKNLFKDIDTDKLFSNITEILEANVAFWKSTLFPLVRDMRKYKRPTCLENMLEGFSNLDDTFKPYYKYCAEQSRCQHYCRENLESEVFTAYLTWCESQKDCNRLRLMDILVQPMQRLTKYGLLLKAILKNTDEDVEKESLQSMIKVVDEFVNKVNTSLKRRQDNERLNGIIARIESYDIVESKDDDIERILRREKSFTQLDLTRSMLGCPPERKRHLLLEGDLKLKDSGTSKIEVHCFLLTDMLLICKPSTKKGVATMRVIRQPYLVDRLVVHELNRETPSLAIVYRNEFDMAVAAFILQSNDTKKIKGWKDGLAKAQLLYAQAKQTSCIADESLDTECSFECNLESDFHSLQLVPRSPMASSSRASRVSSLAHSHR